MRVLFGAVSLLIALIVVAALAKKQVTVGSSPSAIELPASSGVGQLQQLPTQPIQTQMKQTVDSALQQRRLEPDDK